MADLFTDLYREICAHPMNSEMQSKAYKPLYTASSNARIVLVGQAPGRKAQLSMKPWDDTSGDVLRGRLGITKEQFYNQDTISLLPMDFYYPGKGIHGDLPPRKDFAPIWHPKLLTLMPSVQIIILVGVYAQKYYLGKQCKINLTETVRSYKDYVPYYFPLVHPSPLNFRRQVNNPWFKQDVIPELQKYIHKILV